MTPPDTHPSPSALATFLATLGGGILELARAGRRLACLYRDTVRVVLRGRFSGEALLFHLYAIGNRSLVFIMVTLAFLGVISIYMTATQIQRIIPDFSMLGAAFIKVMVRQLAPSITALMVATRVGTGIAAEIGSMVVTEQVDALRMCGVQPVGYLIVPRFLACVLMTPVMTVVAMAVALVAAPAMAHQGFGVNPRVFLDFSSVTLPDLATGLTKTFLYGAAIPVVAGYCGLYARGGSAGVGRATTRAVIGASLAVLVLDLLVSVAAFLVFAPGG